MSLTPFALPTPSSFNAIGVTAAACPLTILLLTQAHYACFAIYGTQEVEDNATVIGRSDSSGGDRASCQ
jgi:hypothetical protein